jgi:hypothetical protein
MYEDLQLMWVNESSITFRYYPGICVELLRKITRDFGQDMLS